MDARDCNNLILSIPGLEPLCSITTTAMIPPKVTQWTNENFPKPRVDPVSTRQIIIRIDPPPSRTGMVGRLL